tara:strand:- start:145 stop:789 length:645 start_codon:yes stop_codon:yes gene_type:complete
LIIDLHNHTYPKSDDSFISPDELVIKAKDIGLDGICLTEHDSFWTHDDIRFLSWKHDFLILPGVELNTDAGHVLAFGLDEYVFGMHKPEFLVDVVTKRGGALVAAHPYRRRFLEEPGHVPQERQRMMDSALEETFLHKCNAIESANGRGSILENEFSEDLARMLQKPTTGGSDAHRTDQVGTVATRFQNNIKSISDLVREIRSGNFEPIKLSVL